MKPYSTVPVYSLKLVKEKTLRYPVDQVSENKQAAMAFRAYLSNRDCEYLAVIMLDNANAMIGIATLAIGGVSGMHLAVREVFKHAIASRAHAFILGHNHPSGDPTPSLEDITFTEKVLVACGVMGIPCLDHVIVSSGRTDMSYSFFDSGLLARLAIKLSL